MDKKAFAARVKRMVEAAGSRRALARRLGVSDTGIMSWLGESVPFESTLRKVSATSGISFDWLRDGSGDDDFELAKLAVAAQSPRERLKQIRERAGLSLVDFSHRIGYSIGVLQAIEDGNATMPERMARRIAREFPEVSTEDLLSGSDYPRIVSEDGVEGDYGAAPMVNLPKGVHGRYVPLLSWAQAGALNAGYVDDSYDYRGILALNVKDPKAYALEIRGDSMSPQINEGDHVIVCPTWEPRSGDVVIAKTKDGDAMCKVLQTANGERIKLLSYNPLHPTMEFSKDELQWIVPVGQITKNLRRS
jgi:SOS-response transcriptional repressor LexA